MPRASERDIAANIYYMTSALACEKTRNQVTMLAMVCSNPEKDD
jgi:hypothetical protein